MTFKRPALTLRAIVFSWLVAIAALATTVVVAVGGQGIGAWFGGADWIGIATPIHRQPWALVNQPNLAFAASQSAIGYWLGSLVAGLGVSLGIGLFLSRASTMAGQLAVIQFSWAAAVLTGAWYPLSDLKESHVARFLKLHRLPEEAIWIAPLLAAVVVVPVVLRLLALGRSERERYGLGFRLLVVHLVLIPPVGGWIVIATVLGHELHPAACAACLAPVLAATFIAWGGWGRRPVLDPTPLSWRSVFFALVAVILLTGTVVLAGRPLPGGRVAGVIWGVPNGFNNIRPWIDARKVCDWIPTPLPASPQPSE